MELNTLSVLISTDKNHTPETNELGWEEGSIIMSIYPDVAGEPPGDNADLTNVFTTVSFPATDEYATKYDGWYSLIDQNNIRHLPMMFRDFINDFVVKQQAVSRIYSVFHQLMTPEHFPNEEQRQYTAAVRDICIAVLMEQPIMRPLWAMAKNDPDGYVLMGKNGKPLPGYYTTRDEAREHAEEGQYLAEIRVDAIPDGGPGKNRVIIRGDKP